ncbi:uncharacterized protein [Castor canadensis]|uniref:Uncharacterized protein n=1 Tax=Castor canadensis TaxID=51338 RepID=A0AC58M0S9_CASCN
MPQTDTTIAALHREGIQTDSSKKNRSFLAAYPRAELLKLSSVNELPGDLVKVQVLIHQGPRPYPSSARSLRSAAPGGRRPPAAALCPGPGRSARPRRHWACSEAGAGAGWLRRALTRRRRRRRADARLRRELGARSWSCREFPATPPSSRAAAGARAGAASRSEPAPGRAEPGPELRAPRGAAPGAESCRLGRVPRTGTSRTRARLQENSLCAHLTCSTMSAKSAISKEIFAPLDERMLGAVQVKRRTKKKIPFLATGGQGEYLTYICLSVTLKNAAMLLEFAAMYSAEQLKLSCLQFIGLNMAALLEARSLDVLSDDVLKDLSVFYRKMGKIKSYINGTPPTYSREDFKPWEKSPDISWEISAPQPIPSNRIDNTSSSSWVAGSLSPVSPPVVDLRTIMETEESRKKCGATPKSNLGKMISHGVKLSQKQRKMIALPTKESNSGMNSMETVLTTPSKLPKPANACFRTPVVKNDFPPSYPSSTPYHQLACFQQQQVPVTPLQNLQISGSSSTNECISVKGRIYFILK